MSKFSGKKFLPVVHFKNLLSVGFTIGRIIGEGTYSKVCVARTTSREGGNLHKLACKIINKNKAGTEFIKKFLPRELEIIRNIDHPNIVTVYKILEMQNTIYIFMEFCNGGDLLEFIREHGALSEHLSKYYFRQLTNAVNYLHEIDLAHRDLKCENVFLTGNNQVKLGDFGFSRSCLDEEGLPVFSDTFCGSAAYAAPEILQGISYDPKLYDIWALGCILYIMITSTMPFDDTNIPKMLKMQIGKTICNGLKPWKKSCKYVKLLLQSLLEPNVNKRVKIHDVIHCKWLQDTVLVQYNKSVASLETDILC